MVRVIADGALGQFRQTIEQRGEARFVTRAVVFNFGVPHTKGRGGCKADWVAYQPRAGLVANSEGGSSEVEGA